MEEKDIPGAQAWFEVFVTNGRPAMRVHGHFSFMSAHANGMTFARDYFDRR